MAMTLKENSLAALRHETYDFMPSNFDHLMAGFGAVPGPAIEKGPLGGGPDGFGVCWVPTASGDGSPVPVHGEYQMDSETITDWKKLITFPNPAAFDWKSCSDFELTLGNPDQQAVEFGFGNGPFERLVYMMGFEEALMALALEPEACFDFMSAVVDYKINCLEYIKKYYHADIVTNYDDIATNQCTFMSPEIYRTCIKPVHKKFCDAIKSYDMIPLQHTCGKADSLIDDFIDTGAAAWTSVQPVNDILGMLKKYGHKFCFSGGYDTSGKPGQVDASPQEVTREVHRCLDTYGPYPGYMFFGFKLANSLDPQEHVNSVLPIIQEAAVYRQNITLKF